MFNLEKSIQSWKQSLKKSPAFEEGQIKEMETHLRDEIDEYIDEGFSQVDAFEKAVAKFGPVEQLEDEVYKTKTTKLVDATPPWKQRSWIPSLLPNFFKVTIRSLLNRKGYSLLNIVGLAFGMAAVLVIAQYVYNEYSYDNFHEKRDRIFRVSLASYQNGELAWRSATSYPAIGPTMKERFPEVINYARLYHGEGILTNPHSLGKPTSFREEHGYYADASVFDVLSFNFIAGNPASALTQPHRIVISESMATKYFGEKEPIGKILILNQETEFTISGVFNDYPKNSHLSIDYLLSYPTLLNRAGEEANTSWRWYSFYTYVLLKKDANPDTLEEKLPAMLQANKADFYETANASEDLQLQPLQEIYLYSRLNEEPATYGNGTVLNYLILIAGIILLIAWINYINLSTARSLDRAKEVGIRKVSGAHRHQLASQFLMETFILNFTSCILAILIAGVSFPLLTSVIGKNLSFSLLSTFDFWIYTVATLIVGTLISGLYPAFVLSSFRPAIILKGKLSRSMKGIILRRGLVIFQFSISLILIVGTITIYRQVNFMLSKEPAVNIDQTMVVRGPLAEGEEQEYANKLNLLKNRLRRVTGIKGVTTSAYVPGVEIRWTNGMKRADIANAVRNTMYVSAIDYDFVNEYEINILSGRNFSKDYPNDNSAIMINESAARIFNFENPGDAIGHQLVEGQEDTLTITGVFENYYQRGLKNTINSMVFILQPLDARFLSIKTEEKNIDAILENVETSFETIFPGTPFEYFFLDRFFDQLYQSDRQFGKVFSLFSLLAILVASLGLWGLASLVIQNRTKEIGIRKILGANVLNITASLTLDFWKLILVSIAISTPISYYLVMKWLQNYPNRIEIGIATFALSTLFIILITVLIISYHTFKTAQMNPVKSLNIE